MFGCDNLLCIGVSENEQLTFCTNILHLYIHTYMYLSLYHCYFSVALDVLRHMYEQSICIEVQR